ATRLRYAPILEWCWFQEAAIILDSAVIASRFPGDLAFQRGENILELTDGLGDQLAHLGGLFLGILAAEPLPRPADGKALVVQQRADLADQQHILTLVVAAIAAALDRVEHGKRPCTLAQHRGLHIAQLADFTDGEIACAVNRCELFVVTWFQHSFPTWP